MFDFRKLISIPYLFKVDTILLHRSDKLFFGIGIVLIVVGIVCRLTSFYAPHKFSRRFWQRLSNLSLTIGILEVLWFGFRYENIPAISTHFVALLLLLIGVVWLFFIIRYRLRVYPVELGQWEKEKTKQKYLQPTK